MTRDYTITRINWNDIEIEIRWNPDYMIYDDQSRVAHMEVESISPRRAPLPITETGYRSHFTAIEAINVYVSPTDFVEAWLHRESFSLDWQAFDAKYRQLSLF